MAQKDLPKTTKFDVGSGCKLGDHGIAVESAVAHTAIPALDHCLRSVLEHMKASAVTRKGKPLQRFDDSVIAHVTAEPSTPFQRVVHVLEALHPVHVRPEHVLWTLPRH